MIGPGSLVDDEGGSSNKDCHKLLRFLKISSIGSSVFKIIRSCYLVGQHLCLLEYDYVFTKIFI